MSPRDAIYAEIECTFCKQAQTVEIVLDDTDEDTLEVIREHINENAEDYASMGVADDPQPHCSYPTDTGPCSREVDHEDDRCWQHEESDG